jgi:hypothetical protein
MKVEAIFIFNFLQLLGLDNQHIDEIARNGGALTEKLANQGV